MKNIAVFPGTFDPFTIGHEAIVRRALPLFDHIFIAVGVNTQKNSLFSIDDRIKMIDSVFASDEKVVVEKFSCLTVDYCHQKGARYILRGLRTAADFEYERAMGQMNKKMAPGIDTIFLLTSTEHTPINSTIVRDIIKMGGDASPFVPKAIKISDYLHK